MTNILKKFHAVALAVFFIGSLLLSSGHAHEKEIVRHDCQVCHVAQQNRTANLAVGLSLLLPVVICDAPETFVSFVIVSRVFSSKQSQAPPHA